MSWWLSLPPLPCARTIFLGSEMGSGQEATSGISLGATPFDSRTSDDIVFSQCDVNEIPGYVNERGVDLLNAMNAVGWHNETVIRHFREAPTVLAEPGNSEHFPLARGFESI